MIQYIEIWKDFYETILDFGFSIWIDVYIQDVGRMGEIR